MQTQIPADKRDNRASIVAETRAWVAVALALVVNITGGVWWAATISAELKNLRELVVELNAKLSNAYTATEARRDFSAVETRISDHEDRLRHLEKRK